MDLAQIYDPELVAVLQVLPVGSMLNWEDLPASREFSTKMFEMVMAGMPDSAHVVREDRSVPGPQGAPDVPVLIYRPARSSGTLPALFWIHGGGYVIGDAQQDDIVVRDIVEAVGCVVVSVDYRLAPEHPFPAPVEDCYAALKWTAEHAGELGIDRSRIAVGGSSAGGGLAAGLVLLARDRGEVPVIFQLLIYPMLDDRDTTLSSEAFAEAPVWTRQSNRNGWRAYLGEAAGGPNVSPYAAAARATNLSGLPPTYMAVGSHEVFLDEDIEYAQRLLRAGIPVELHVYPRTFHGWDALAPEAAVSRRCIAERNHALKQALHPTSSHSLT